MNIDLEIMPLHVLPEKFQSFSTVVTRVEDLEKIDLFNKPIPGKNVFNSFSNYIPIYFVFQFQVNFG